MDETPRHDFTLTKHSTFSKWIRFKPGGVPLNLTGSTVTLFVKPWGGEEFEIDKDGPAEQKLIIVELDGKITIYMADETIDDYDWRGADYRLQIEDGLGNKKVKLVGEFRFETLRA